MVPSDSKGYYLELPHLLLSVAILSGIISKYLLVINCHWGEKTCQSSCLPGNKCFVVFIQWRPSCSNCSFCVYCSPRQADKWQGAPTSTSNSEYIKEQNLCVSDGMSLFSCCPRLLLPNLHLMAHTEGRGGWAFLTMKNLIAPKRKKILLYLLENKKFWTSKIPCISIALA